MRYKSTPIYIDDDIFGAVISFGDITLERQMEDDLFHEKERVQVTLESIGEAVVTTDIRGRITYLNPAAVILVGLSDQKARGMNIFEVLKLVNEISRVPIDNPIEKVMQSSSTVNIMEQVSLINHEGREISIEATASPIKNKEQRVIGIVLVMRNVSNIRKILKQISYQESHDVLTGLINRVEFEQRLLQVLKTVKGSKDLHALLYLDLDDFKVINDTCSHYAGDELLRQLTTLLLSTLRASDTLARTGGDEFGMLLEHCTKEEAVTIAQNICNKIHLFRFNWKEKIFSISASIGIVFIDRDAKTINDLLSAADQACYMSKDKGGNRLHIYHPEDSELAQRHGEMQILSQIYQGLEKNKLCLYYQPIAPIANKQSKGEHYELLVRMIDTESNLLLPAAFLPAAERYNLMPRIDRWVVETYFKYYNKRYKKNNKKLKLCSINLSGETLNDDSFLDFVISSLEKYSIPPHVICFEITETAAIANYSKAVEFIKKLKNKGCKFALDDFGSGLSSFNYLKHFPVDYLKIDGIFIKGVLHDPLDYSIVDSIKHIGHVMNMKIIAEYVENKEIFKSLKNMGVDFGQGYGISKPLPIS
ncbi:EAL domain-containing protein [Spirochaetota bacterium]